MAEFVGQEGIPVRAAEHRAAQGDGAMLPLAPKAWQVADDDGDGAEVVAQIVEGATAGATVELLKSQINSIIDAAANRADYVVWRVGVELKSALDAFEKTYKWRFSCGSSSCFLAFYSSLWRLRTERH